MRKNNRKPGKNYEKQLKMRKKDEIMWTNDKKTRENEEKQKIKIGEKQKNEIFSKSPQWPDFEIQDSELFHTLLWNC